MGSVSFDIDELDEIVNTFGPPIYQRTDDGEAWYWKFKESDLPVADTIGELFYAGRQRMDSV